MKNILTISDSTDNIQYRKSSVSSDYSYKPTINELIKIYEEDPADIFMYDTGKCITIITDDGQDLPLCAFKKNIHKASFIKITNDILHETDNEILVSCDHYHDFPLSMTQGSPWRTDCENDTYGKPNAEMSFDDIEKCLNDYNGYKNCKMFLSEPNAYVYKAVKECLYDVKRTSAHLYQGYVPAMGQSALLSKCQRIISYILKYTGNTIYDFVSDHWTSTYLNGDKMWICTERNGRFRLTMAGHKNRVIPIYKQIK